ncbi:GTP 3',8-cyclase MoaA [Paenibacillus sophorae]|nr:GTP 3',8-cyclase MoaA [Paenibacillus sophorae]QWU18388.1 GTP 3',8-cyclase MoaA [Paenibacillus sophorae]
MLKFHPSVQSQNAESKVNPLSDPLVDSFGRVHNYVRLSITDRCNLGCQYCRPGNRAEYTSQTDLLTFDDMVAIVNVLAEMGVTKVRITGGEPLLRPRLEELVARLGAVSGIRRIGLTTNGLLLASKARELRRAGLTDVNISLDSLLPERYAQITRGGDLGRVLDAIEACFEAGFETLKLNVVLMQGVNDDEIESFLRLTLNYPLQIRFIEYMPVGMQQEGWNAKYMPLEGILAQCAKREWNARLVEPADSLSNLSFCGAADDAGPAKYYRISGAAGEFGLINPVSEHFCMACNRLRITANGYVKPCLYWNDEWDLKPFIGNDERLRQVIRQSLEAKPQRHEMIVQPSHKPSQHVMLRQMSQIGG